MRCPSLVIGAVAWSLLACVQPGLAAERLLAAEAMTAEAMTADTMMTSETMMPQPARSSSWAGAWRTFRDAKNLSATGRWAKSYARSLVIRRFGTPERRTRFGLELDEGWQKAPVDKGLVVLIHGYQSRPERHDSILKEVRAAGIPCGVLRYPNDQPLDKSAALLAKELRAVAKAQPERRVTLLALSMGGLVARAVVEDPAHDPGNVGRLLLVATPNHGSQMARYAVGADVFEFLLRSPEGSLTKRLYASVEDGLGEAAGDLRPGSEFLRALNARRRNPKVHYSLFLGTGGPLDEDSLRQWRQQMSRRGKRGGLMRFISHETGRLLEDLDEVIRGKGDGIVALERGRLEGVPETVVLPFVHRALMDGPTEPSRQLRAELLKRLIDVPNDH
jgi:pimeloyl-ACP methyl ester carboxylesterase